MRISDWSSDVCSSDLFGDMNYLICCHRVHKLAPRRLEARHGPAVPVGLVAAIAGPPVLRPDDLAMAVLHEIDDPWSQLTAVIGQHRIGIDQSLDRCLSRTQSEGEIRGVIPDAHSLDGFYNLVHAGLRCGAHGHQVA